VRSRDFREQVAVGVVVLAVWWSIYFDSADERKKRRKAFFCSRWRPFSFDFFSSLSFARLRGGDDEFNTIFPTPRQ
jgi:hypothetical protein